MFKKMMMGVCLALSACGSNEIKVEPKTSYNGVEKEAVEMEKVSLPKQAAYRCQNEKHISVTFEGDENETAVMTLGEEEHRLSHAISASGARYSNAQGYEYWSKGKEAFISLADNRKYACYQISE